MILGNSGLCLTLRCKCSDTDICPSVTKDTKVCEMLVLFLEQNIGKVSQERMLKCFEILAQK